MSYEKNLAHCAVAEISRPAYENLTCGDNLRSKIAETERRLADLKEALTEAERTGLADTKINAIRDMMQY